MTVKDEKGRILSSENPVITGMWKTAGYKEVKPTKETKTGKETKPEE